MKKKILLLSTRAITLNNFFDKFILNENVEYILGCSDIQKLKLKSKKVKLYFDLDVFKILNPIYIFINFFRNYNLIRNLKFDLILVNTPLAAFYVRIIAFILKKKIIYIVHGFRFHESEKSLKSSIFFIYEKLFSLITTYYVVLNKEDYRVVLKNFNKKKKNILKLPSIGIDFDKLIKIKCEDSSKKLNIGVIAAYRKNKGYNDLIEVAKRLQIKKYDIYFNCYGYDQKKKYIKFAEKNNLKNIHFNDYKQNIFNIIKKFDLVCHFSRREGMPISILESVAIGVPVICYNIRGNKDIIKNKINGYLIKPYNISDFEKKIIQVYKNNNHLNILKKNCKKSVSSKHNKIYIKTKIDQFINEIR